MAAAEGRKQGFKSDMLQADRENMNHSEKHGCQFYVI